MKVQLSQHGKRLESYLPCLELKTGDSNYRLGGFQKIDENI